MALDGVCSPIASGGLCLRSSHFDNRKFMVKSNWELCIKPKKLWIQVVRAKYNCTDGPMLVFAKGRNQLNLWKGLCLRRKDDKECMC